MAETDVVHPARSGGVGTRRWFGTDGVRGVVGEGLTAELVEQLGRAATLWSGRGRVLVGRDTRGSGPALEAALTRGIVDAGGTAVLGGVLPTPAVALLSQDLGLVVSASHNPPEYNGVKVFDREGHKLTDADELEIEALVGAPGPGGGSVEHAEDVVESYVDHVVEQFGSDLGGLRIAVDCANGAFSAIAPGVFERLGAEVTALAATPNGSNINDGCGATDLAMLQAAVRAGGHDLGIAFDGDGDRYRAIEAAEIILRAVDHGLATMDIHRIVDRDPHPLGGVQLHNAGNNRGVMTLVERSTGQPPRGVEQIGGAGDARQRLLDAFELSDRYVELLADARIGAGGAGGIGSSRCR